MTETAGYSGKPLADKLGVKPGDVVLAIDPPDHYADLLAPLPPGAAISRDSKDAAVVHAFCRTREALQASADRLVTLPRAGGVLWISWPKKASPHFVDLTENDIRAIVLPTGWVDVKVCAVDKDWSGLKFLRRRSNGAGRRKRRDQISWL